MSSKRCVLLIGYGWVTTSLAHALHQNGHSIVLVNHIANDFARYSRTVYKHYIITRCDHDFVAFSKTLLAIIQDVQPAWVIPVMEEMFYMAHFRDHHPELRPLIRIPETDVLLQLHDKKRSIDYLSSIGCYVPETYEVRNIEEAQQVIKEHFPAVPPLLKPAIGCGGVGHFRGNGLQEINQRYVVQEFIVGPEYSCVLVCHAGYVCGSVWYHGEYCITGEKMLRTTVDIPVLWAWGERVASALQYTGVLGFDVILTAAGLVVPLECNPRFTCAASFVLDHPSVVAALTHTGPQPLSVSPMRSPSGRSQTFLLWGMLRLLPLEWRAWLRASTTPSIWYAADLLPYAALVRSFVCAGSLSRWETLDDEAYILYTTPPGVAGVATA